MHPTTSKPFKGETPYQQSMRIWRELEEAEAERLEKEAKREEHREHFGRERDVHRQ